MSALQMQTKDGEFCTIGKQAVYLAIIVYEERHTTLTKFENAWTILNLMLAGF